MPAFSAMAAMKPSFSAVSSVPTGEKPAQNIAPMRTPMNSEEYASLVTSARTIAMIGGRSAQKVPYIICTSKIKKS